MPVDFPLGFGEGDAERKDTFDYDFDVVEYTDEMCIRDRFTMDIATQLYGSLAYDWVGKTWGNNNDPAYGNIKALFQVKTDLNWTEQFTPFSYTHLIAVPSSSVVAVSCLPAA